MLLFEERGKTGVSAKKTLRTKEKEPTTNSTHIWRRRLDLNPGHIAGRRVLSPLRHPFSPREPAETHHGSAGQSYDQR